MTGTYTLGFRAGKRSVIAGEGDFTAEEIIRSFKSPLKKIKQRFAYWFDGLQNGAEDFIETTITFPEHNPERPKPRAKHTKTVEERKNPETLFIGAVSSDDWYARWSAAGEAWVKRQALVTEHVRLLRQKPLLPVFWTSLTPRQRLRFERRDHTPEECWVWRPLPYLKHRTPVGSAPKASEYREFYIQVRGPLYPGIVLRHSCDNRLCMNPNHLQPGTSKENTQDMMARKRHPTQTADPIEKARKKELTDKAWTPKRLQTAALLLGRGYTAKEIAQALGNGITTNSVADRMDELADRSNMLLFKSLDYLAQKIKT